MVLCWGKKRERMFRWGWHRRKDALLKQARERTRDEGVFAKGSCVLVCLTLIAELSSILSGFHREKHTKKLLVASVDSGRLTECCQLRQIHMLRQDMCWEKTWGGHAMFRGRMNRTQQTERGLLVELAVKHLLVLSLHWSSLCWDRHSWEPLTFLVIQVPPADLAEA